MFCAVRGANCWTKPWTASSRELGQKLERIEEVRVFAEGTLPNAIGILPEELHSSSSEYIRVEQHLPLERLVADLLQRSRRSGDVLGETLLALRIDDAD